MNSRYKNITDYFKQRDKVIAQAIQWLGRALPKHSNGNAWNKPSEDLLPNYVTPARVEDAAAWDETNHANSVYLWCNDGHRLHAAIIPLDYVPEGVKTHEGRLPVSDIFKKVDDLPRRAVTFSAQQLRDAIAPGADRVTLLIPTEGDSTKPVEIASIVDAAQIGYAILVPYDQAKGRNAQDWRVRRPDFRPLNDILKQLEAEGKQEAAERAVQQDRVEQILTEVDNALGDLDEVRESSLLAEAAA